MAKGPKRIIRWLSAPEEHNYPAADSYLRLLYAGKKAAALVLELERAPMTEFKSKDIFRASGLSLLGVSNSHVQKDIKKIAAGKKLSPILLVRDEKSSRLIIADGYHRLCSVYTFDEDAVIPCKIV
jgi:disulfide oxidoreductase YuzD